MKLLEILELLTEPVATERLSKKKVSGNEILYISWYDLIALLQERCGLGGFEWEVQQVQEVGVRVVLTGRLTVYGEDGGRSMDATGQEVLDCSSYGDPSSNAEAMALRRACAKFGLGLSLWKKEETASLLASMRQPKPIDPADYSQWTGPDDGIRWASKELDMPMTATKALWEEQGKPGMKQGLWTAFVLAKKKGESPAPVDATASAVPEVVANPFG